MASGKSETPFFSLLKPLFAVFPVAVAVIEKDGQNWVANPAFEAHFGSRSGNTLFTLDGGGGAGLNSTDLLASAREGRAVTIAKLRTKRFPQNDKVGTFLSVVGPSKEVEGFLFILSGEENGLTPDEQTVRWTNLNDLVELAGKLAHDLNNHLNIMMGYGERAARETCSPEDRQKAFSRIHEAGSAAAEQNHKFLAKYREHKA